jgi:hypothetical protein
MKLSQTGGCLCGALRYEITQAPVVAYTCHCTHCQRLTSSAFSMAVVVAAEAFHYTGADPRPLQRTADSGRTSTRWVCPGCGTWLCGGPKPRTAPPGTLVMLRAGTLDDTSWLRPTVLMLPLFKRTPRLVNLQRRRCPGRRCQARARPNPRLPPRAATADRAVPGHGRSFGRASSGNEDAAQPCVLPSPTRPGQPV